MRVDFLIVQVCEFLDTGDGLYRFHDPSKALCREPGVCVVDCDISHRHLPQLAEVADVLILAGFDWDYFALVERRRAAGRVTVFEANDYYYDLQSWNPIAARWLDRGLQSSFSLGLARADGVQTSTHELVRRWKLRTPRPVRAFPNQLTQIPPLAARPQRPLTIGWGGSPGHFADWYALAPLLEQWLKKNTHVHLAVMNNDFAKRFIDIPEARYHYEPFGSLAQYEAFLQRLDIGLAPLLPSDYNRCRSDVKFLEYASHGVAGIYADLEPYRDSVVDFETGLFYRTPAGLISALDRLAADGALRRRIREAAHAYVSTSRRLEQHVGDRLSYYRALLAAAPRGYTFAPEMLADAVCDGRYVQLRPGPPEQVLKRTQSSPRPDDSLQQLRQLVSRHPDYLQAHEHLGQMLNDHGESSAALEVLERAQALQPGNARSVAEAGRARFRLGQYDSARERLEHALLVNPLFLPGWQYLLRLLDVMQAGDAQRWAQRAVEHFPDHYALALLALRLYPKSEIAMRFKALVERIAPTLTPQERPLAAAAFGDSLRDLYRALPRTGELLDALELACATFGESARLAHLYGDALRTAGRISEGHAQHARALQLQRIAQTYGAEFPKDDGALHYWQFAEHIERPAPGAPDHTSAAASAGAGLVRLDGSEPAGAARGFGAARSADARMHLNRGRDFQVAGDLAAAAASYAEALRLEPDYAIAHNNLGALLHARQKPGEAAVHLRRAIELRPGYPEAHYNLGNALQALDEPAAACASYREALRLRPGYVNALLQLGVAHEALGEFPEAMSTYQALLGASPEHGDGWQRMARLIMLQRRWDDARAAFEKAARFAANPADVLPNLVYVRRMLCDWSSVEADSERLWALAAARLEAGQPSGVAPFFAVALAWPGERQLAIARAEARGLASRHTPAPRPARSPGARLRIAYLSGDFRDHAVSHLTQGMFALHDRGAFEVFAYSYGADDGSSYRSRIRAECEHFVDVRTLSTAELARRIAADGIDILIDMMGYSGFSRLEAMASRPAPVQASWLSYPGTTGADFIDYAIVDCVVVPPALAPHFSEKLAYLPHSFLVNDHRQPIADTPARRAGHGLPENGFVFCSWNNSYKIEPRIFEVWMRLLRQTPGSVLWLYTAGAAMEANLRREASARGVSAERLVFGANLSPKAEHLARLRLADLFLDTHLYNAHTTACDALWAGVPLVTCAGQSFASRVAASLLSAVGLPELIAADLEAYERIAATLAKERDALGRVRAKLAAQRMTSPLFDTARFVRNLERAYRTMWEMHEAGDAPRTFEIVEE
jgi:predicted O-linked N-acetylglucosamine transferase (SPINDLY family)